MTWSGFRPSDDACSYGYLIPANMFAVVVLGYLAEIARDVWGDTEMETEARRLAGEIDAGIQAHGIVEHPSYGAIYAYEADGLGHHALMDDANVPSLLSIPYLGYRGADDPLYQNTRRFILSRGNPYFFEGSAAAGIGSPHTPHRYIWPLALAMQGLTATDPAERERMLDLLERTDAGTQYMHESFFADNPGRFTRSWFAWANALFSELVLAYCGYTVPGSPL
jgi:meiotically up-regulated gene 157 (Mug157) protein